MSKISPLADITNLETTALNEINSNFNKIESALQNTVSRDGSSPNAMAANLDMGLRKITNLGAPSNPTDAVRYQDIQLLSGALDPALIDAINNVGPLAEQAAEDAASAAASAALAASYVGAATSAPKWTTARTITLLGDVSGSQSFDGSANFSVTTSLASGSVTASKLSSSAITDKLGYTPASRAGDTFSGDIVLSFTPTNLNVYSVGFRGVPRILENGSRTLAITDSAHMIFSNGTVDRTFTVPFNSTVAFPIGTVILFRVQNTGRTTLAAAYPSIGLRFAGSEVSGSKRINQWGFASLIKEDTDAWVVQGTNVEIL